MNSGQYITAFLLAPISIWILIFIPWELIQSYRRRKGNKTALTASQTLIKLVKEGNIWARIYVLAFPVFLALTGIWLFVHLEGMCHNFGIWCDIDV